MTEQTDQPVPQAPAPVPAKEPYARRHRTVFTVFASIAVLASLGFLFSGGIGMGLIVLFLALVYFLCEYFSPANGASKMWTTLGGVIGTLFVASGLLVTGASILLLIALASWTGSGSGNGK